MNRKQTYVIVEVIPEALSPEKGNLVQISALKIQDFQLLDRFDVRLKEEFIQNFDVRRMIDYDRSSFDYVESSEILLENFSQWTEGLPLYIMDNEYTNNFLQPLTNKKVSIVKELHMEYTDDFIEKVIEKYQLLPSNYIVDLLFEALIYESNQKKS